MANFRFEGVAQGGAPLAMALVGALGYALLATRVWIRQKAGTIPPGEHFSPRGTLWGSPAVMLLLTALCGFLGALGTLIELFATDVLGKWWGFALKMSGAFTIGGPFCVFVLMYAGALERTLAGRWGRGLLLGALGGSVLVALLLWWPQARDLFMVGPKLGCSGLCTLHAQDFGPFYPLGNGLSAALGLYAVGQLWTLAGVAPRVYRAAQIVPLSLSLTLPFFVSTAVGFGAPSYTDADLGMWGIALGSLPLLYATQQGGLLENPPTAWLSSLLGRSGLSLTVGAHGRVVQVSPALERLTIISALGKPLLESVPELLRSEFFEHGDLLRRDGRFFEVERQALGEGRVSLGTHYTLFDVTERTAQLEQLAQQSAALSLAQSALEQAHQEARYQADHDALTDLYNLRAFRAQLGALMLEARAGGPPFALVLWDVDDFRFINASVLHEGGDAVLVELAARLRATLPPETVLCRVGGEEFVGLFPGLTQLQAEEWILKVAQALQSSPFVVSSLTLPVSMTASSAGWLEHGEALLLHADRGLGQLKYGSGGGEQISTLPKPPKNPWEGGIY